MTSVPSDSHAAVLVAGASGDLGLRITRALVARGANVRALVRANASSRDTDPLTALGVRVIPADVMDVAAVASACAGAACVVSALNGLRDVIIERQAVLLDAAVQANVPRIIPSDFCLDYTHTTPGENRNLDVRRELMARVDAAKIRATSIFNGAFMDMLGEEMPMIQPKLHRVLYWQNADQPLDFTTKDNVAAFTAAAALDPEAPRILRIAGAVITARELAGVMSEVTSERYKPQWAGNVTTLGLMIRIAKFAARKSTAVFPAYQGMQYSRDMFSGAGKLAPLDNARYPGLTWTSMRDYLALKFAKRAG